MKGRVAHLAGRPTTNHFLKIQMSLTCSTMADSNVPALVSNEEVGTQPIPSDDEDQAMLDAQEPEVGLSSACSHTCGGRTSITVQTKKSRSPLRQNQRLPSSIFTPAPSLSQKKCSFSILHLSSLESSNSFQNQRFQQVLLLYPLRLEISVRQEAVDPPLELRLPVTEQCVHRELHGGPGCVELPCPAERED